MARHGNVRRPVLFPDLDRRSILAATVRTAAIVALTLLLYFFIPVDGFNDANNAAAWARLTAVVLVFLAAMTLQIRLVADASAPLIRAAEAIVQSILLFICLFSTLYTAMSVTDSGSFNEPLGKVDALYFTSTVLTTVGFGDITPQGDLARAVVTVQMLAGLGVLVLVAKVFLFTAGPASRGRRPG